MMCKVYNEYHGTSEIEHDLCACTVDNPLAKARALSLRTGAQTILYLSPKQPNGPLGTTTVVYRFKKPASVARPRSAIGRAPDS